jgi:hypothetical protein
MKPHGSERQRSIAAVSRVTAMDELPDADDLLALGALGTLASIQLAVSR